MEPFRIIVMEKDLESGMLTNEITSYKIDKGGELIGAVHAEKTADGYVIDIKLTTDRDLEDWEYSAVFDYYDIEALGEDIISAEEDTSFFNPVWAVRLKMDDDDEKMEAIIQSITERHMAELESVYEEIKDKREDYREFDETPHVLD